MSKLEGIEFSAPLGEIGLLELEWINHNARREVAHARTLVGGRVDVKGPL